MPGKIAHVAKECEDRNHDDGKGDHHGGEHESEESGATLEADLGESVGDQGGGKGGADDDERGDDQGVAGVEGEIEFGVVDDVEVVGGDGGVGDKGGRKGHGVFVGLEAGRHHPDQREEEADGDEE